MAGKDVAGLFVLWSKVDFLRKFGTLHGIDSLPPSNFQVEPSEQKNQVLFSSNRDNVNSGQYCTENKQALPRNPH